MSGRYSNNNKKKKDDNKNIKALFSVVCLCIIALGMIVYFSTNTNPNENNAVNENQTLEVTTDVQRAVTIAEDTTAAETTTEAEKDDDPEDSDSNEIVSMPQGEGNTPYKSFYEYPLSETVIKGYSEELVKDETMGDYRAHAGVDFKGSEGDEVRSINSGMVINIYDDNLYGGIVEVDHGGNLIARYCGLESITVKMGQALEIGDKIGTLGAIPAESAEESHLHFETRLDGKIVNPLDVMGKTE